MTSNTCNYLAIIIYNQPPSNSETAMACRKKSNEINRQRNLTTYYDEVVIVELRLPAFDVPYDKAADPQRTFDLTLSSDRVSRTRHVVRTESFESRNDRSATIPCSLKKKNRYSLRSPRPSRRRSAKDDVSRGRGHLSLSLPLLSPFSATVATVAPPPPPLWNRGRRLGSTPLRRRRSLRRSRSSSARFVGGIVVVVVDYELSLRSAFQTASGHEFVSLSFVVVVVVVVCSFETLRDSFGSATAIPEERRSFSVGRRRRRRRLRRRDDSCPPRRRLPLPS